MRRTSPLLVIVLLSGLAACAEPPGEVFQGVINAPRAWTVPTTGKAACVVVLETEALYKNTSRARTRYTRSAPRFAAGALLALPDGGQLRIEGTSDVVRPERSDEVWTWTRGGQPPPAGLLGRDPRTDAEINATQDPAVSGGPARLIARERYAECGDDLALRGVRDGEVLRLVEINDTASSNALKLFGVIVGAFLSCGVLPVALLIVLVVRRAKKKQAARGG